MQIETNTMTLLEAQNFITSHFETIEKERTRSKKILAEMKQKSELKQPNHESEKQLLKLMLLDKDYKELFPDDSLTSSNPVLLQEKVQSAIQKIEKAEALDESSKEKCFDYIKLIYQKVGSVEIRIETFDNVLKKGHYDKETNILSLATVTSFLNASYYSTVIHEFTHEVNFEAVSFHPKAIEIFKTFNDDLKEFGDDILQKTTHYQKMKSFTNGIYRRNIFIDSTIANVGNAKDLAAKNQIILSLKDKPRLFQRLQKILTDFKKPTKPDTTLEVFFIFTLYKESDEILKALELFKTEVAE